MLKLAELEHQSAPRESPAEPRRRPGHHTLYYAFMSYSHRDRETADWLHRELERFRVPHSIAGRLSEHGTIPSRLTPIFRDRHELAAAGDLGEEIRDALVSSRFLIVLCSPDAAQSRWTNAEIDTFKRDRPDGCVLAAIVAGEPFASDMPGREAEECFPPALRYKYDRRGRPTSKRAEPLAADLRESGDGRRMGFLKLVAGMLGVGLDELVQRETMRRHRRLGYLAAASLAGMAVTSTLAITAVQARDEARDQRRQAEGLVAFMLGDLKEKLEPIGRLDVLDSVGGRALAYYQGQDTRSLSDESLAQRSRALTLVGEIANARGNLDSALRFYRAAFMGTAESLRRHPDDPQRLFDHAQNVYWVGYIAYQHGRTEEAAARFREYKRLADRMVTIAPDNKDYRREVGYASTNLGTVLMEQRRYGEAARTYDASLRVAEDLAAAEPRNPQYAKQVSNTLAWLADAREYAGDLDQALATRERQLRLLEDLERADARDMEVKRDKMTAHRAVGRLLASRGDVGGGIEHSLSGVAISETLFRVEPENTEWLQANATGRFDLAEIQLGAGQLAAAAATIRSGCDIVDRLVQRSTSVADWKVNKRVSCLTLRARLALQRNEASEALSLANEALGAARLSPEPVERSLLAMRSLSVGSSALERLGRKEQSMEWARRAIRTVPPSMELRPSERAEIAALQLRAGDRTAADRSISTLRALGYRHPLFVTALGTPGAART